MKSGRRGWLAALVPTAVETVAQAVEARLAPADPKRRRPPGAVLESTFLTLCTRCDACMLACPEDAVHRYVRGAGDLALTPVMRPETQPCLMCDGFPCAAACETGALVVPEGKVWPLGTARILEEHCFTFMGPECGACVSFCPTETQALRIVGTRPVIDETLCVGCGLCIPACPTMPKAIEIIPLHEE